MTQPSVESGGAVVRASLSRAQFERLAELLRDRTGIDLPPHKRAMMESRLQRRLRALSSPGFDEYVTLLGTKDGAERELSAFIDVMTTNKTDFFREPAHFEHLAATLPTEPLGRPVRVWCAACSSGEEAYTLSMVLAEHARKHPGFVYRVIASDVSRAMLAAASRGVYPLEGLAPIPWQLVQRYMLRGSGSFEGTVAVSPAARRHIEFLRVNLVHDDVARLGRFDAVFCRNVLMYFGRSTVEAVLQRVCGTLRPGARLYVGHSEALNGMELPLIAERPAVYRVRP